MLPCASYLSPVIKLGMDPLSHEIQKYDNDSIPKFITGLRYEAQGSIFGNYDVDAIFTSFVCHITHI